METEYSKYKEFMQDDIEACLENMYCQPILFVGSGLSQRYINAPTWSDLLGNMATICPNISKEYAYYCQTYNNDLPVIGEVFIDFFKEWAWENKDCFPHDTFDSKHLPNIFLKHKIAEHISEFSLDSLSPEYKDEVEALESINPHAVITTNYDYMLENIFSEYEPVIGQKILYNNAYSIGEIYKIHGCVSEPDSLIVTKNDYEYFDKKQKYLSAKLLTYFAEHPLLFIGYSASDSNIIKILSDIDEILRDEQEVIPNIYFLEWDKNAETNTYLSKDISINLNEGKRIRIKRIVAKDFTWVFKAFSMNKPFESIHPKLLRAFLARTYDIVRSDIPKKNVSK